MKITYQELSKKLSDYQLQRFVSRQVEFRLFPLPEDFPFDDRDLISRMASNLQTIAVKLSQNQYYSQAEQALENFRRLIEAANLEGELMSSYYNMMGILFMSQDKLTKAAKYYKKALKFESEEVERASVLTNLAAIESRMGDFRQALKHMDEVFKITESLFDHKETGKAANLYLLSSIQLINIYYEQNDFSKVISTLESLPGFIKTYSDKLLNQNVCAVFELLSALLQKDPYLSGYDLSPDFMRSIKEIYLSMLKKGEIPYFLQRNMVMSFVFVYEKWVSKTEALSLIRELIPLYQKELSRKLNLEQKIQVYQSVLLLIYQEVLVGEEIIEPEDLKKIRKTFNDVFDGAVRLHLDTVQRNTFEVIKMQFESLMDDQAAMLFSNEEIYGFTLPVESSSLNEDQQNKLLNAAELSSLAVADRIDGNIGLGYQKLSESKKILDELLKESQDPVILSVLMHYWQNLGANLYDQKKYEQGRNAYWQALKLADQLDPDQYTELEDTYLVCYLNYPLGFILEAIEIEEAGVPARIPGKDKKTALNFLTKARAYARRLNAKGHLTDPDTFDNIRLYKKVLNSF